MSTRAVRKLRAHEEAKAQALVTTEDSESEEEAASSKHAVNPFLMLGGDREDDGTDDEELESQAAQKSGKTPALSLQKSRARKKKKKKTKTDHKQVAVEVPAAASHPEDSEDEIDAALKSLNIKPGEIQAQAHELSENSKLFNLLSIDTRRLLAENEMRKLFGRMSLRDEEEEEQRPANQRGRRGGQAMRTKIWMAQGVFVRPEGSWPPAQGVGLGMELTAKEPDGSSLYHFHHSQTYREAQGRFKMTSTTTLDPQELVNLMHGRQPYHVSTLLQVSLIMRIQQADSNATYSLLARALYSFSRGASAAFLAGLREGKARLAFRRREDREFFTAAERWRSMLGSRRSLWSTAAEWGKLLLALDPANDPSYQSLTLPHALLRSGQGSHLLDLARQHPFSTMWATFPNVQFSLPLAILAQKGADSEQMAREYLEVAISRFPWVVRRLYSELDISAPLPALLWGIEAPGLIQQILAELWILQSGRELYAPAEVQSLLIEVSSHLSSLSQDVPQTHPANEPENFKSAVARLMTSNQVSTNLARFVLAADIAAVVSLLPKSFTNAPGMQGDQLPPSDSVADYEISAGRGQNADQQEHVHAITEFLRSLLPWISAPVDAPNDPGDRAFTIENLDRLAESAGFSREDREALRENEYRIFDTESVVQQLSALEAMEQRMQHEGGPVAAGAEEAGTADESGDELDMPGRMPN